MNTTRIAQAIRDIEENTAALKWLEEYGPKFDARNKTDAEVNIRIHLAGACPGAKEATSILSSFARLSLPELIKTAIQNCRNTIEMAESAIREESAK